MRPVRLRLENFGPYRAPVEVDFEKLGGLFLVHGKTGSGKTTLFDAMTYALYGEAPGARSSFEKQLASHWAEPGEGSSVSFEFLASGTRYLAERNPPSRRLKRNGELDYTPASASLSRFESGEWKPLASMVSEVGAAVTGLLGLSADEFSKVVLLPQGEFENFLRMNSRDRTAVLEKLFPVDLYEASTRLARDRSKAAEDAASRVGAELARVAAAEPEGGAAPALVAAGVALEEAEARRQSAAAEATALALALEGARTKLLAARRAEAAANRLASLEARRPELLALEGRIDAARRAAEAAPAIREAKRLAAELASVESRLEGFRAKAREIEANEAAMDAALVESAALVERLAALDGDIGTLTAALVAWDRALDVSARRDRAALERDAALAAAAARGVALEEAESAFAAMAVEDGEDERRQQARDAARAAFEAARDAKARADARAAERAALERSAGELAGAEAARAEAEARLAALDARMLEETARRDASIAASLAATLVSGAPCPVCGSTEHPAPARSTGNDAPDADALRSLEAERRAALEAFSKAAAEVGPLADAVARGKLAEADSTELEPSVAAASLAEAVRADEAAAAALRDLAVLRRKRDEAARAVEAAREDLKAVNELLVLARETFARLDAEASENSRAAGGSDPRPRLAAARKERSVVETRRAKLEADRAAHAEARSRVASAMDETIKRLEALRPEVENSRGLCAAALVGCGFGDEAAASAAFVEPGALAEMEKARAEWDLELAAARAAAEEALHAAEGPLPDVDELARKLAEAEGRRDLAEGERDRARDEAARLRALVDDRTRLEAERQELDARHARLSNLSQLLSGTINQRRLPFKNYALSAWFRAVVERGNLRLREMSGGRYSLAVEDQGGRGYGGLDLTVRDAYTGSSRPTGTLSGGERFLASVSLALGLADAIRERSGGASLEAVFIDEGFGSLDEEALDRAISALESIRGARVIGIVSHVAALRSRVASRIEVVREREGSRIVMADGFEEE